jgi:hypothetical protein
MYRSLLLILLLGYLTTAQAQNLSGKWVGYFTTSSGVTYPYVIQIQDQGKQNLIGTTLTKFSLKSSAKASAIVYFSKKDKSVSIIETKFEQLFIGANMQACLMNNQLKYSNENGREKMQGTYMSNNLSGSLDCGTGSVMLIKEFELVAKKPTNNNKNSKANKAESNQQIVAKQIEKKDTIINTTASNISTQPVQKIIQIDTPVNATPPTPILKKKYQQIPWVLISRENKLIRKIITKNNKINIELIDNGSFDNETISVYDNNVLILDKIKLSYKAFHFDLTFNEKDNEHTIILVANEEGKSQFNSSLMTIKDGSSTEEFYISPNIKNNNKIIIKYQPKP